MIQFIDISGKNVRTFIVICKFYRHWAEFAIDNDFKNVLVSIWYVRMNLVTLVDLNSIDLNTVFVEMRPKEISALFTMIQLYCSISFNWKSWLSSVLWASKMYNNPKIIELTKCHAKKKISFDSSYVRQVISKCKYPKWGFFFFLRIFGHGLMKPKFINLRVDFMRLFHFLFIFFSGPFLSSLIYLFTFFFLFLSVKWHIQVNNNE